MKRLLQSSFTESVIRVKSKPKTKSPVLVIGLPGVGLVSKLCADNLVNATKAKHYASVYSPHFPNQIVTLENGRIRAFAVNLYYGKLGKQDLIIAKGDLQPMTVEGQYELSSKILSHYADLGGSLVVSMAGYAVNKNVDKPAVFASATSKALFDGMVKSGAVASGKVIPVVGMAGMMPSMAKLYGMAGACLLVETPGPVVDAKGALALTNVLSKYLKSPIATQGLEKQAVKTAKAISEFEKQQAEAAKAASTTLTRPELSYIH